MTVKDLIKILEQQNPDTEVVIDYTYTSGELGWSTEEHEEGDIELTYNAWGNELHLSTYDQTDELEIYGDGIKIFK